MVVHLYDNIDRSLGLCELPTLQVVHFINLSPEQQKTQPPLGYEHETEAAAAADGTKGTAAAADVEPEKPKGRVIVVGAGPAGMAAASILQVRGAMDFTLARVCGFSIGLKPTASLECSSAISVPLHAGCCVRLDWEGIDSPYCKVLVLLSLHLRAVLESLL